MKERMFKCRKIVIGLIMLLSMSSMIFAQEKKVIKETSKEEVQTVQKSELKTDEKQNVTEEAATQKMDTQQDKNKTKKKKDDESTQVKQVKGSNPDLSKAKGARPPYIVRPSGSGIPKGAGKPGGAIRPGRR